MAQTRKNTLLQFFFTKADSLGLSFPVWGFTRCIELSAVSHRQREYPLSESKNFRQSLAQLCVYLERVMFVYFGFH